MSSADLRVTVLTEQHWPQVRAIYAEGIAAGDATFETEPGEWASWDAAHSAEHRFVALLPTVSGSNGEPPETVVGWVAVSPVSSRCVYAGVVEHSVYVRADRQGNGIGRVLLDRLIESTEQAGIWSIRSGVFPENTASLALHRNAGFRVVGVHERVGRHHGRWRDVVLLERRSPLVGLD